MIDAARTAPPQRKLWPVVARSLVLLLGLASLGFALRELPQLRAMLADKAISPMAYVLIAAAGCALGLPRQAAAFAGGYAFGPWEGTLLSLAAQMLGGAADFLWARFVARDWAARRMGKRLKRLNDFLAGHPFTATLTLRLLPVGNNVALCLLAGVSAMPALPFMAASLLGYVPQTLVFALLGSGVQVGKATEIVLAVALFIGSALMGLWLLRRRPEAAGVGADNTSDQ